MGDSVLGTVLLGLGLVTENGWRVWLDVGAVECGRGRAVQAEETRRCWAIGRGRAAQTQVLGQGLDTGWGWTRGLGLVDGMNVLGLVWGWGW